MNQKGAILLLTVLVIGALSGAIVTSLTLSGIDNAKLANNYTASATAQSANESCIETALLKIKTEDFVGQDDLSIEGVDCSLEVINEGAENRTIQAITTDGDITKRHLVAVSSTSSGIEITGWQEVESF
jgi:hypothetical protein